MEQAAKTPAVDEDVVSDGEESRAAPRFTTLIRPAKLISGQGEFVCVIRDVSETGISVRMFHKLPSCETLQLQMPSGDEYEIRNVWHRGSEAGFEFTKPTDVTNLIHEAGEYPKRGLRLGVYFPVKVSTLTDSCEAFIENVSQQGARIDCEELLAINQTIRINGEGFNDVSAKVRWRREGRYGVVFDDTFTLSEFAHLLVELQAPVLLDRSPATD
ncbi:MAG: PilZ domain-containing protein [Pseudomonadota bacterium]